MSFKQRVFNIIGPSDDTYVLGRIFDLFITLLILASVVIVFVVTFDIPPRVHSWLLLTEGAISVDRLCRRPRATPRTAAEYFRFHDISVMPIGTHKMIKYTC